MTLHHYPFEGKPSRRTVLGVSLAAIMAPARSAWAFGKSDFWNQKEPAAWSENERQRILTNSPWAKKASISMGAEGDAGGPMGRGGRAGGGPPGGGPPGGGFGGGGPIGGPPGGGPPGEGFPGGPGEGPDFDIIVRWEDAAPIQMASKEAIAPEPDAYLISVSGFPDGPGFNGAGDRPEFGAGRGQSIDPPSPESMARTAQLEAKGQPALHASKAERLDGNASVILFHFDRGELPISGGTKEVTFSCRLGPLSLRAKFSPKEMLYKNQTSL